MSSNFAFLGQTDLSSFQDDFLDAEKNTYAAPMYSAMLSRKALEKSVRWLYEHDYTLEVPYDANLSALLHEPRFKQLVGPMLAELNLIRKSGNNAVHSNYRTKSSEALAILKKLHRFAGWILLLYSAEKVQVPPFDTNFIPQDTEADKSKKQLQLLEKNHQNSLTEIERLKVELQKIKAIKVQNLDNAIPPADPNEAETRSLYIDVLLREAGWDPQGTNVAEYEVEGIPKTNGTKGVGYVDYVLWGQDGKPLAVVEAKRTKKDPRIGENQARLYADNLEMKFGQRPLIFLSNGYETYLWDNTRYPRRQVLGFYTQDELQLVINRRALQQQLVGQSINEAITNRYYQKEALGAIAEQFDNGERKCLLVMATGTGKTRTAAALVELMSKAGWVKRVLFLADRVELVRQAKRAFNDHLPEYTSINLVREKETDASRITFSTYQTLIHQIDGEKRDDERYFGVGHFDLIIFDEIHRSVYNKYRAIFSYFDGLKVGLTATPKEEGDKDTYELFDLEAGNPTYAYELEEGIKDQYLVPYRSIPVPTKFHREGIKYDELSEEEQVAYEEEFADNLTGELPKEQDSKALNDWLFNQDTVDQILAYVMKNGHKIGGGDRLGKTIIFARNKRHAQYIKDRFDVQFPAYKGEFSALIAHEVVQAHNLIDQFKEPTKDPFVAVSVDMLDTGVDVPEVVNLVIYKPVKSKAKFWQMIGRGTRLSPDLYGIGEDKFDFMVFDLCENFEFFKVDRKEKKVANSRSLSERLFRSRLRLSELLRKHRSEELRTFSQELRDLLIQQTQALNLASFLVSPHLRWVEKYLDPNQWNALDTEEIDELMVHVAPLVVEIQEHENAKRFDALCYDSMLAMQLDTGELPVFKDKVVTLAERLSKKGKVPDVASQMNLIMAVQEDQYWENATITQLDHLRVALRDLMKLVVSSDSNVHYTNFKDELLPVEEEAPIYGTVNLEQYRKRVERYLREHKDHLVIDKLYRGLPITPIEVQSLEDHLFGQGELVSREQYQQAYGDEPLLRFIRRIIGMDTNAAKEAFSEFLSMGHLNTRQIRFINTIIDFLSVNGAIDPEKLFEPPFTDIDAGSIMNLFDAADTQKIRKILDEVNNVS